MDIRNRIKLILKESPKSQWYLLAAIAVVAVILPFISDKFITDIIFNIVLYAIMAEAWNLLTGYSGPVSLGHIVYFGFGAYVSSILYVTYGVNPWLGLIIAAVCTGIFAGIMGIFLFRLKSHFFALSTMALLYIVGVLATYFCDLTGGNQGCLLPVHAGAINFSFNSHAPYIYVSLAILTCLILYMYSLNKSKFGFSMIAVRENEDAAKASGIKPIYVWIKANIISAVFMSLAGTLHAQYVSYLDPHSVLGQGMAVKIALYAIIGGLGTVIGPLLGALIMVPVEVIFRMSFGQQVAGLNMAIYGVFLIIFVLFARDGLIAIIKDLNQKWKKKKKRKQPQFAEENSPNTTITPSFCDLNRAPSNPVLEEVILKIKHLSKQFGGLSAVKDFNLEVHHGEVVGLIGPNGAGKTTLFNIITGFLPLTEGSVYVDGKQIKKPKPWILCDEGVVRTFQLVKPFKKLSILENVIIGAYAKAENYHEAKVRALDVIDFIGLKSRIHVPVSELTVSELKKLEFARALATDPKVILLDEVMSGLTPSEGSEMCSIIDNVADQGIALVIVEHVMQLIARCCDRVFVLNFGETITSGPYTSVINDPRVIEAYLGGRRVRS